MEKARGDESACVAINQEKEKREGNLQVGC